jgi:hypothetical protein
MNLRAALALMLFSPLTGADGLRDPMRPPMPPAPPVVAVHEALPAVTAIFVSGQTRKAIVGGRLVHAGDSLGDGTVEAVSADGVTWRRHGFAHELQLPRASASFKKPATGPARTDNGVQ